MSDHLLRGLRRLAAVKAPATLLPAVLAATGTAPADSYSRLESELGSVFIAYNEAGISAVMRANTDLEFSEWFGDRFGRPLRYQREPPDKLRRALGERLTRSGAGRLRFDLHELTPFERDVLLKTLEIPRGEVRTYGWIAREIGRPGAVRAVGTALGNNPIPYLIPCHRVIRSDGHLGQYSAGGTAAKREVLALEGLDPDQLEGMARARIRYQGSDTTHIFCFPTCRNARRITDAHRVAFHSEREALATGYRPCKVCRPALVA